MELFTGDCLEIMPTLEDNSVDTIITDPPYGLTSGPTKYLGDPGGGGGFMGKAWDHGVPGVPFWAEALRVAKPGATLLAFGGDRTHHRLMVAIEDAGWEIRTCIYWAFGQGFPKSANISKMLDRAAGAERGVVGGGTSGKSRSVLNAANYPDSFGGDYDITAPATPAAELWNGWGTGLKPAVEIIVVAMKPLDRSPWLIELTPELLDEWEAIQYDHE